MLSTNRIKVAIKSWEEVLPQSGVMGILGKRRQGKTGLAYYVAELRYQTSSVPGVVWGPPPDMANKFPAWMKIVSDLGSLLDFPGHTAIVDEGSLPLHARQSLAKGHTEFDQALSLCGQLEQLFIVCTHHSTKLDLAAVREFDLLAFKRPGRMHTMMERSEIRQWSQKAREFLMEIPDEGRRRWSYVLYDDLDEEALIENPLPTFWSEEISIAVSTAVLQARRVPDYERLFDTYRKMNWVLFKAYTDNPPLALALERCVGLMKPAINTKVSISAETKAEVLKALREVLEISADWGNAVGQFISELERLTGIA